MKLLIVFLLLITPTLASEFGQYRYSKYIGLQQQLSNQRLRAARQRQYYNQSPTRNIRYPNSNNPYPNIERRQYQRTYYYR